MGHMSIDLGLGLRGRSASGAAVSAGPTVVQAKGVADSGGSIVLSSAPTRNNLLIAMQFHYNNSPAAGAGWTQFQMANAGVDGTATYYKIAGSSESATQTPTNFGTGALGALVVFEVANYFTGTGLSFLDGQFVTQDVNGATYNRTETTTGPNELIIGTLEAQSAQIPTMSGVSVVNASGSGGSRGFAAFSKVAATGGSYPITGTFSPSSGYAYISLSIKPYHAVVPPVATYLGTTKGEDQGGRNVSAVIDIGASDASRQIIAVVNGLGATAGVFAGVQATVEINQQNTAGDYWTAILRASVLGASGSQTLSLTVPFFAKYVVDWYSVTGASAVRVDVKGVGAPATLTVTIDATASGILIGGTSSSSGSWAISGFDFSHADSYTTVISSSGYDAVSATGASVLTTTGGTGGSMAVLSLAPI